MPKKSTPVRSGAQRSKPKTSKAFELVRPDSPTLPESEPVEVEQSVTNDTVNSTERSEQTASESEVATTTQERIDSASAVPQRRSRGRTAQGASGLATLPAVPQKKSDESPDDVASTTPKSPTTATIPGKGSASEKLAARRQGAQKLQQRNAATLITAEHYSYVRRDLMFIAALAIIMFIILAVMYFIPGI